MMNRIVSKRAALFATVALGLVYHPAAAQTADQGEAYDDASGAIVVTARKREENLLDVPVVAAVISQDLLERRQTIDLKDVASVVPGLSLSQTLGVSGVQVSLRGVGTNAQNAGIDASIALNIDGLQLTQGIAYSSAMFDVERIEVLKGPQALFFGKNSPGGVIALRSADPGRDFALIGSYGYEAEAREHRGHLILSGPASDTLRLRLAGQYYTQDGYYRNNATATPGLGGLTPRDRRVPGNEGYVVRGTALWQPSDSFEARLKVNLTKDRLVGGVALQLVSCPDGTNPVGPRNIPFLSTGDCAQDRNIAAVDLDPAAFVGLPVSSGAQANETRQRYGTLELNYDPIPELTLSSVTGYYRLRFESQQSGSPSSGAGPGLASLVFPFTRREFTQEFRATSDTGGPVNFTAGMFYQNAKLFNHASLRGNTALGLAAVLSDYEQRVRIETMSAFAQLRWQVSPQLELAGGARGTKESRELAVWNLRTGPRVPFPVAVPKINADDISPEATLTYKPSENTTLFASYKKGFKSGSFNLVGPSGVLPNTSFGDESVQGYEVGAKAQFFDRRLFTSLAFYDYRYKGLQVGVNVTDPTGFPAPRTLNAGSARAYGIDFEASYRTPIDGLQLRGAILWNRARFTRLDGVPCSGGQLVSEGCNQLPNPTSGLFTAQSLTGSPLLRAPEWQVNFGFDLERDINSGLKLRLSSNSQYSSRYLTALGRRDDFFQPSFFKTDATLTLAAQDDRWELALIGKNLTDRLTSGGCVNFNAQNGVSLGGIVTGGTTRGPAGVDEVGCYMDRGREVWLRLTLRPFG